jgi:ribosomal-protein-serine acetyltransferase
VGEGFKEGAAHLTVVGLDRVLDGVPGNIRTGHGCAVVGSGAHEREILTTAIPAPMFCHPLAEDAALVLRTPAIAEQYHALIVANLERLALWEPWAAAGSPTLESTRGSVEAAGRAWLEGSALPMAIAVRVGGDWRLVGSVGLRIDGSRRTADIGFWIDGSYEGRGLVSRGVTAVLDEAFGPLGLEKVTLHAEVANVRSRALARHLGFVEEGVLRAAIAFPNERRDDVAHGLLASEWRRSRELDPGAPEAPLESRS